MCVLATKSMLWIYGREEHYNDVVFDLILTFSFFFFALYVYILFLFIMKSNLTKVL